jgi:hypothetical protein
MQQRQAVETRHELVGRERRQVRPNCDPRLLQRLLDRVCAGRSNYAPVAQPKGQKIAQRDRPVRGHSVVERAVEGAQDLAVGQLGEQFVDRLVKPERAFFDKIMAAAAAIGLVTEAMRKIVSRWIGSLPPSAFMPIASTCTSPRRLMSVTMPGTSLGST